MPDHLLTYAPLVLSTFFVSLISVVAFVPHVRDFAKRVGAVQHGGSAHGLGERIHSGAMPNIGGIAIFFGFITALLVGSLVAPQLIDSYRVQLLAIILGAALMTLVGFIDDIWDVSPPMRLAAQVMAAAILVVNGVKIGFITNYLSRFFGGNDYVFFSEGLTVIITLLWVVGFTNAFNFIDGLDGLSSGMAAISSLALLTVALQFDQRGAAILLLAAIAGASLGFLRHNFNPATIIMGDSGAYLLGYVLAAVSVLGALKVTAAVTVAVPVLILGVPVMNITQVTLRRLRRGRSPARAANDHLHDILRVKSGSKRATVLILWSATLLLGMLGMMLSQTPPRTMVITLLSTSSLIGLMSYLRLRDLTSLQPASADSVPITPNINK